MATGGLFLEVEKTFHPGLCRRPACRRVVQSVKLQMDRVRYLSMPDPGQLELLLSQHRQIVAALEAGQSDDAGRAMAAHRQEVLRTVLARYERRRDPCGTPPTTCRARPPRCTEGQSAVR